MKLYDLIASRRTIREFEDKTVSRELIERFVNVGRLAPQAANRQPLEFVVVDDQELCEKIFPLIKMAGYLDWKPSFEMRPRAFIAVLANTRLQKSSWAPFDAGFACENICLAAWEEGVGTCLIGSFDKKNATELLKIPEGYELPLLVALGYPAHKSVAEDMTDENIKYRRDEDGTFHVPKRPLKKIIHFNGF